MPGRPTLICQSTRPAHQTRQRCLERNLQAQHEWQGCHLEPGLRLRSRPLPRVRDPCAKSRTVTGGEFPRRTELDPCESLRRDFSTDDRFSEVGSKKTSGTPCRNDRGGHSFARIFFVRKLVDTTQALACRFSRALNTSTCGTLQQPPASDPTPTPASPAK